MGYEAFAKLWKEALDVCSVAPPPAPTKAPLKELTSDEIAVEAAKMHYKALKAVVDKIPAEIPDTEAGNNLKEMLTEANAQLFKTPSGMIQTDSQWKTFTEEHPNWKDLPKQLEEQRKKVFELSFSQRLKKLGPGFFERKKVPAPEAAPPETVEAPPPETVEAAPLPVNPEVYGQTTAEQLAVPAMGQPPSVGGPLPEQPKPIGEVLQRAARKSTTGMEFTNAVAIAFPNTDDYNRFMRWYTGLEDSEKERVIDDVVKKDTDRSTRPQTVLRIAEEEAGISPTPVAVSGPPAPAETASLLPSYPGLEEDVAALGSESAESESIRQRDAAEEERVNEEIAQEAVARAEEETRSRSSSFGLEDLEEKLNAPRGPLVNVRNPWAGVTLKKRRGGMRKRTLKKRRGVNKRNVRRTRRRKNRSNRTHQNTR